jgi:hypothetical protein
MKLILLEGKIMIYSNKSSKVCTFVLSLFALLPGGANFNFGKDEKINKVMQHYKAYGLPLKVFNNRVLFLPLSTLNDLDLLSECKGFLVGCTNKLLSQYPSIKLDWFVNLDDWTTEFRPTELWKIAKAHSSTERNFIYSLVKDLKQMATEMSQNDMYCWDSTNQDSMPEVESLDHADLRAKNAFSSYFKQLLCRMAYAEVWANKQEAPSPEPVLISEKEFEEIKVSEIDLEELEKSTEASEIPISKINNDTREDSSDNLNKISENVDEESKDRKEPSESKQNTDKLESPRYNR